jgi:WD40 repeat protein
MAEATDLVKFRQEKLPALVKMIRGDLDWIVMKAVAKDRTRRYETANGLAMDVQRYLNGEAISARQPSRAYRLQKFVHRNKALVGAGASMLVVLVLGAVVSSWQAIRATRAEREGTYLLRVAEAAQQKEVKHRQRAETERLAALRQAYNSDMNLVPQALLANNYGRMVDLLNRHRRKATPEIRSAKSEVEPDFRQWEWRYFWNQAQSDAAFAFPKQSNTITTLVISSDGRFLASSDRSGTLKLWDLFRRSEIATLREGGVGGGPGGSPFAFSPQGDRLAVALNENPRRTVVKVWSSATREVTAEVAINSRMQALAFSTNGARLLLFGEDGAIRAWDFTLKEPVLQTATREQGGRFPRSFSATFSPDAKFLAFTEAGRIRLIDAETGLEKSSMPAFEQGIASLAFSPDGGLIAASPFFTEVETSIKLFSTTTGAEVGRLAGHVSWIPAVTFSSDGKRMISAGADQTVRIWNVAERQELAALRGHHSEVNCVALSSDGKTIVSGCKDGTLFGWDAERADRKKPFETLPAQVASMEFFPDSHALLSINRDGSVALWDAATLQERERISALGRGVEQIVISPDGARLYAGSREGRITVFDWATRSVVTNLAISAGRRSSVVPVGVIDHGRTLLTAGPESAIRLWDTATWQSRVLAKPKPSPRFFRARLALSPDERLLAMPGSESAVEILNVATAQTQVSLDVENWGASPMAFSPDSALLAMASREGTVNIWDVSRGTIVDVLRGHLLGVHDVAFSPDGERLASASAKNEAVKLWDVTSRHEVATLAGEGSLFERVQFSPDGTLLVAINSQGKAHIWRAPALQEIEKIEAVSR